MEKTVLFMILEQYADFEAAYINTALQALGNGKFKVKTVALTKEPVHSYGGFVTLPDYSADDLPEDYEALLLIGGMCWREEKARQVQPLVEQALAKGKFVGGICDAAGFLATTGVLNEVTHTGNDLADIKRWAGASYTGEQYFVHRQAVRDGKIITANGTASLEFAKEVMLALQAASVEAITTWYEFYKLGSYTVPRT